jgi:putative ABC transport system substrate-binding protein
MQFDHLKRREFITLLGGAAAWPLAARGQQAMPVIGFLSSLQASDQARIMAPFHRGLAEVGWFEARNVTIEYRWAQSQFERLPALATDLVKRQVTVIAAISGTPSVLAAKAATTTIPIVFGMGSDPIAFDLVASLNRPGGNITGATFFTVALGEKRLGLVREMVPNATVIAVLVNPANPVSAADAANVQAAAHAIGQRVRLLSASTSGEIDAAFATVARERPDALLVEAETLFLNQRDKVAALAARHAIPTMYGDREMVEAGGLISYGASRADAYRQAGIYTGRILKGEKPADLPVMLPTRFELVINLKTAKTLGLTVPDRLLAIADEVIE